MDLEGEDLGLGLSSRACQSGNSVHIALPTLSFSSRKRENHALHNVVLGIKEVNV